MSLTDMAGTGGLCPKCDGEIEFKGNDLFATCEYCGMNVRLSDEEYNRGVEKLVMGKTRGLVVGSVLGNVAAGLICIVGFLFLIVAWGMPAIFAGQYLLIGIIIIICGIVVFILVWKYAAKYIQSKAEEGVQEIQSKAEEMASHNPDPENKAGNFCESCGNPLKPTAKFCGGCGTQRS